MTEYDYSRKWVISVVNAIIAIMATIVMILGKYSSLTAFLFIVSTLLESIDHAVEKEYYELRTLDILSIIVSTIYTACVVAESMTEIGNIRDFLQVMIYITSVIYPVRQLFYTKWYYEKTKE